MSLNTVFSRPFLLYVGLIEWVVSMVTEHVHFCLFTSLTPELIISVQVHVVVKRKEKKSNQKCASHRFSNYFI